MQNPTNGSPLRGIGFSGVSSGDNIYNNTFYDNGTGTGSEILPYTGSSSFSIENNIFDDSGWPAIGANAVSTIPTDSMVDYNDYYNVMAPSSRRTHSVTGDPKLENPGNALFWLVNGSAAHSSGVALGSPDNTGILSSSS